MGLFDVYPLFDIEPVKAQGCKVWDKEGNEYLDLYGGHAVISIGHTHPHYVSKITEQLNNIGFYSNSIQNPLQKEIADKLEALSGKKEYNLFLCNSGAEAIENALKLASFANRKKKIISFTKGFHGRTSMAVALTDNPKIVAPVNETDNALILPYNDEAALEKAFAENEICAVIIEGIQGIGGINMTSKAFMQKIASLCKANNAVFIADSVQCGYARSGKFFSHDYYDVEADVYTMAKGMGNGFPIGGIFINPKFEPWFGMLGTTFGGNHLACAAAIAVLDVIKEEKLLENATKVGEFILNELKDVKGIVEVRGKGLMIGIELNQPIKDLRMKLLKEDKIFTGSASSPNVIRILPPLNLTMEQAKYFVSKFKAALK